MGVCLCVRTRAFGKFCRNNVTQSLFDVIRHFISQDIDLTLGKGVIEDRV